jgi:hypothetical protein
VFLDVILFVFGRYGIDLEGLENAIETPVKIA